jgi:6-phosphogluconolactonase
VTQREGAGPRHFVFHPGGHHAYLLNELDATVSVFTYDDARGTLEEIQNIGSLPPGFTGTPWAADIHLTPDGAYLYTSERRSSTLAVFAIGADGRLHPQPGCATEREPRAFAIAPCGRYLLAVGQASHSMTSYAIDPGNGSLRELRKYAMGRNPNWVEIVALPSTAAPT